MFSNMHEITIIHIYFYIHEMSTALYAQKICFNYFTMQITSILQNGQHSNAEKVLKAEFNMKKKCIILINYLIPLVGSIQGSRVINEQQESIPE